MPTYHVEMLEGRTVEQKRHLVEEITRISVEILGGAAESAIRAVSRCSGSAMASATAGFFCCP